MVVSELAIVNSDIIMPFSDILSSIFEQSLFASGQ